MAEHVAGAYPSGARPGYAAPASAIADVRLSRRHLTWGAIIAGVIIVLIVQLLLSLLGVGVGASTIDPTGEVPTGKTLGIGAGLWWVVSSLIAVFVGSWVASRLAGIPDRVDGMLHGLVTWGLSGLVVMWLLTTTLSSLIGGAFSVVGTAVQAAGQAGIAGATAGAASQGDAMGRLEQQANEMIGRVAPEAQQARQQIEQAVSDDSLRQTIWRVVTAGPDAATAQDRETAINALVQYAGMSRPEAEQRLGQWEGSYRDAEQKARRAAEASADAVAQGALWTFVAFGLGAILAAVGGMIGAPREKLIAAEPVRSPV